MDGGRRRVSTATTTTVGGLQNGDTYWFRVAAKTYVESVATAAAGDPGVDARAPFFLNTNVSAAAGGGSFDVQLTWASALPNGSAVTDYVIEWSLDGNAWTRVDDGVSTATSYTVKGLTGGKSYVPGGGQECDRYRLGGSSSRRPRRRRCRPLPPWWRRRV